MKLHKQIQSTTFVAVQIEGETLWQVAWESKNFCQFVRGFLREANAYGMSQFALDEYRDAVVAQG